MKEILTKIRTELLAIFNKENILQWRNLYPLFLLLVYIYCFSFLNFPETAISDEPTEALSSSTLHRILLTLHFTVALAGLWLFRKDGYRIYYLTQINFYAFSTFLISGGDLTLASTDDNTISQINTFLFITSSSFLIYLIYYLLYSINSTKKKRIYFVIIFLFIWAPAEWFIFNNDGFDRLITSAILTSSLLVALSSLLFSLSQKINLVSTVLSQTAFWGIISALLGLSIDNLFLLNKDWYGIFVAACLILTIIYLLWLIIDRLFISFWKRKLVEEPQHKKSGKPISIYPEASNYKDVHGKAEWIEKFIRNSDGGVIGLTGVRGAGKSALLNKVLYDLEKEYFTLHITSPVYISDKMEFFMMVCNQVCSHVIDDIHNKIFKLHNSISSLASQGLISRLRLFFIVVVILLMGYSLYDSSGFTNIQGAPINLGENDGESYDNNVPSGEIFQADRKCLRNLLGKIETFLADDQSTLDNIIIAPLPSNNYLDILTIPEGEFDASSVYDNFFKNYRGFDLEDFDIIQSYLDIPKSDLFNDTLKIVYYSQILRPRILELEINTYGKSEFTTQEVIDVSISTYLNFEDKIEAELSNYGIEPSLNHYSLAIGNVLDTPGSIDGRPKLASWIIMESFFKHAASVNSSKIILSRKDGIPKLRDLLKAYLQSYPAYGDEENSPLISNTPINKNSLVNTIFSSTLFLILTITLFFLIAGLFIYWSQSLVKTMHF